MAEPVNKGILWLFGQAIIGSAVQAIAEAINIGRDSGFNTIINEIGAFGHSSILDRVTCPICRWLDGKYFDVDDPFLDLIKPPLHKHCRCIQFAVLKEELIRFPVLITKLTAAEVAELTKNKIG